jgi:hypothetical protein
VVDGEHELLAVLDVRRYVIVVGLEAGGVVVAEVRVDPGDRRQRAPGGVLEETRRLGVDPLEPSFPVQVGPAEEREPVVMTERVASVGETQGASFEGIPAPRDAVRVQMPHERRLVIQRGEVARQVIAAARGAATNRLQPVGPGRPGNRAEPPIANRELARQVIVDRNIGGVVVTHHAGRIPIMDAAA